MFNFTTNATAVSRALKTSRFVLFAYADIFAHAFFYLFIISLLLLGVSLQSIVPIVFPAVFAMRLCLVFAALFLVFLELYLFRELYIKRPKIPGKLEDALQNPEQNIAAFLTLDSCAIVETAIKNCRQRKLQHISSEALMFALLKESRDAITLVFRLGMDAKKLQADLKNYLEKQPKMATFSAAFSNDFEATIQEAAKIAVQRQNSAISDKELLAALAKHSPFFKQVLMDYELKDKDVENITLWMEKLEAVIARRKKFWAKENLQNYGSLGKDWASGFTVNLDRFAIDWRNITGTQRFHGIVGHKKEIDELEAVLAKSNLSNALIVGEPGIGRKSIIQGLAQRCFLGMSLPELNNKRVVELDMVSLLSRVEGQDQLELLLDQIFAEAVTAGNVVLAIDNFDHFVGQKGEKAGTADISGILAKYLPVPAFRFIGVASPEGLRRNMEQSPEFLQYFRKIEVVEISEMETISILQDLALGVEARFNLLVTYPAIREIVNLTGRYYPSTPFPKKAIDVLEEAVSQVRSLKERVMLPHHIAKIISDKTQIPVGKMEFKEKSVLLNLENLIHERLINQAEAVAEISQALRRARSGLGSKTRPMGSFLFLGPTGVGKTEAAKALAGIYFGGEQKMIRLDMSEFQAIADIPRLLGAVSPVEQQGLLTTPVREKPFSLVLLDEIEKAHPDILNLLLQVLDDGRITDGQGRKVMFTNTIIICTSNAGAKFIFEETGKGAAVDKDALLASLFEKNAFRPEFVNRFDATVIFHPLTRENLLDIAQLSLLGLAKNLKEKDVELVITQTLKEKIVELSYKPEFGAREMRRVMQDSVENSIAKALLAETITRGDKIEINPDNFEVVKIQ